MMSTPSILVTICARGGSKGVPRKNLRPLLGKPLIVHSIETARSWKNTGTVLVSTDSQEIAEVALKAGAQVPFLRPAELATDSTGKLPVLSHAVREFERLCQKSYPIVMDLDTTAPIRSHADLDRGLKKFQEISTGVCFSVVPARKNPYFNMIESNANGRACLVKEMPGAIVARQSAPRVWDMNACIYFYSRDFLLSDPRSVWDGNPTFFEMPDEAAFDIDEERDFIVVEALMNYLSQKDKRK